MLLEILTKNNIHEILPIISEINSNIKKSVLLSRLNEMFTFENYICFGLYENDNLIAVSSGWKLTKLYSGNQLELDNFAVISSKRNIGAGKILNEKIEEKGSKPFSVNNFIIKANILALHSVVFLFVSPP